MAALNRTPGRMALLIAVIPLAMFGIGFASKPLYDAFCRVTGFGGTVRQAESKADTILDRRVQIRFDASQVPGALEFRPIETALSLKLGETGLAWYQVINRSDKDVSGIASYNVIPHKAGRFFSKLECFCFERRVFKAGQTYRLPVVFFVDPALDAVRQLDDVRLITLSYTLHVDSEPVRRSVSADLPSLLTGGDLNDS